MITTSIGIESIGSDFDDTPSIQLSYVNQSQKLILWVEDSQEFVLEVIAVSNESYQYEDYQLVYPTNNKCVDKTISYIIYNSQVHDKLDSGRVMYQNLMSIIKNSRYSPVFINDDPFNLSVTTQIKELGITFFENSPHWKRIK